MYTVIGLPATRAARVLWALEELEQQYQLEPHPPRSDAVLAISPSGKIPILRDGDFTLTDSSAIMQYLADKHSGLLAAAGSQQRALQNAMIFRLMDEIDALLWVNARHKIILPEEHRVPALKNSIVWELNQNIDRLAQEKNGPFLCGEDFTAADIIFTHCMGWAKSANIEISNKEMLEHAKEMRARPAFQRVLPLLK
ncbi:glutathione S-transferase [Epibacterium sp. SM1969]|uniref:Glutathione S-transferase n=1 Tax=Tritonibacter aquimaris TaxID=2663379 RepID=A0A844ANE7_9RHOB|nr:glutathione S-transferase family protein [Tritonibacter aquimaris]MQY41793.1 glutathione S-transferase [Tritonibacter aquimaris]